MKLADLFEEEPLLLQLIQKRLDAGDTVLLDAHGRTEQHGPKQALVARRSSRVGKVLEVRHDAIVYDFRIDRPKGDNTISRGFFIMEEPIDEHYTLRKVDDHTFKVVDAVQVTEAKPQPEDRQLFEDIVEKMVKSEQGLWVFVNEFFQAGRVEAHTKIIEAKRVADDYSPVTGELRLFYHVHNPLAKKQSAAPLWFGMNAEDADVMTIRNKDGHRTLMLKDGASIAT